MTGRLDAETTDRARAMSVADVIHHRRIPRRRVGLELVGARPVCGDGARAVAQTGSPSVCARMPGSAAGANEPVASLIW
jgi:hypothetical protein